MDNVVILVILVLIISAAISYICVEKKRGKKCIGCPYSGCKSCKCGGNSDMKKKNKG